MVPTHLQGKKLPPHLRKIHERSSNQLKSSPVTSTRASAPAVMPHAKHGGQLCVATPPPPDTVPSAHIPPTTEGEAIAHTVTTTETRQRLSTVGVRVAEPKPAPKGTVVSCAISDEGEGVFHIQDVKDKAALRRDNDARSLTVDTGKSHSISPTAPAGNSGEPSPFPSRENGRGGRPHRATRWLRNFEVPKGDPTRWDINWEGQKLENGRCSIESPTADSGWVGGSKKPMPVDGIDPETGFKLTGFSESWPPPPLNWDSRPAFRPNQTVEAIETWLNRTEQEMLGETWSLPPIDITREGGKQCIFAFDPIEKNLHTQGEIAPRYWVPVYIGRESPSIFWAALVKSQEPEPLDEDDLKEVKPWWDLYEVPHSCSLKPYQHPAVTGPDPHETEYERLHRENDHGSLYHAENRKRAERAKLDLQRERRKRAQEKACKLAEGVLSQKPCESIKPGLSIYVRSVRDEDMARINQIYNHYVDNTVCVPETERQSEADMLGRYRDIVSKKLPFLVACERGALIKARKEKYDDIVLPDKVVGFAHADDHHDSKGMFRFTADMEVYVDSALYMRGIGKCLSDKLLGLLDPCYVERGGYAIEGPELHVITLPRVISNIIVTVPYDKSERLAWKGRFLIEWLGFEQVGVLKNIGIKLNQRVSVATFQRNTGATVHPVNPPIMCEDTT